MICLILKHICWFLMYYLHGRILFTRCWYAEGKALASIFFYKKSFIKSLYYKTHESFHSFPISLSLAERSIWNANLCNLLNHIQNNTYNMILQLGLMAQPQPIHPMILLFKMSSIFSHHHYTGYEVTFEYINIAHLRFKDEL